MFYVTMRDKFMSGWGKAKGKSNYLLFRCDTEEEAETVADNGVARSDMHKVYIHSSLGSALSNLPKNNLTQWYDKHDEQGYKNWYEKDYFKKA
jgi:hypothetical protein